MTVLSHQSSVRRPYGSRSVDAARRLCHAIVGIMLTIVALPGCHRDERVPVKGTVTIDEQPAVHGLISFEPAAGNPGNSSGASIQAGKFAIPAAHGLLPGKYLVAVQAFQKTDRTATTEGGGATPEWTPILFERAEPLQANVVPGRSANHFDFRLVTKKP